MKLNRTLMAALAAALLVSGGMLAQARGRSEDGASKPEMTAVALKQKLDKGEKVVIIDARSSLNGQIIKGAIQVPVDQISEWAKTAEKEATIVTYCTCPHDEAADSEVKTLQGLGFKKAFSLKGGLDAAKQAGIEIVAPEAKLPN